ncbi:MAG TPA: TIGR03067 domain-containing protein [Gemmata sp.]|nr:TIGR03067 domain-containing protein [Gemmata sp.]
MNRTSETLFLAVAVGFILTATPGSVRAGDPPAKELKELQGTWKLVSVEIDGKATDPIGGQPKWVIKGEKVFYGGAEIAGLKVDASTSPRVIDLKFSDPERVYEGIYAVEKGTLKICINRQTEGTKDRPGKLSTKDQSDWRLLVFEQEKDGNGNATDGLAGYIGLALGTDPDTKEVIVNSSLKDAPSDKAGFKKDDVILKVGGVAVADPPGAVNLVRKAKPGDKLDFRIRRGKEESTLTVKVGVLPFALVASLG